MRTFVAEKVERGTRADQFLAASAPEFSRVRLKALMKEGLVLCNNQPAEPSQIVRPGDVFAFEEPAARPADDLVAEEMPLSVLFEDEHLLILDKPAGVVIHPGAGNRTGTIAAGVLYHCGSLSQIGGVERPGIVHRLDKETSGCLAVCKTDAAHRALGAAFAERRVEKIYLAVTDKVPRRTFGTIDAPIARHRIHRKKMTTVEPPDGRAAVTDYRVVASQDRVFLVECRPRTGRTHQIRVHLKSIGLPVAGDIEYGNRGKWKRHLLHAWRLGFEHPVSGVPLQFTSPLPDDFPEFCRKAAEARLPLLGDQKEIADEDFDLF